MFDRLVAGDQRAARILDETAGMIALAVIAVHALLDQEVTVLGGSIGVRPELVERVVRHIPEVYARTVRVVPSGLGARAGLVGAVSMAVNRLHNDLFSIEGLPGSLALPDTIAKATA